MKNSILFIISFLVISCAKAQLITNYVKNPDFERYDTCPTVWDEIHTAKYWSAVDSFGIDGLCAPENINTCAIGNYYVGAPLNGSFYQYPRSGNGMSMGYYFGDGSSPDAFEAHRNYLQGRLYQTLLIGRNYCVSFYINLANRTRYATNKMGAYLDDGSIDTVGNCSKPITFIKPQVYTNDVIDDTLNWIRIEGSFTANGTERFITLGNFFPNDSITYVDMLFGISHNWAYYLIDDVSVIESNLPADAGEDRWVEMGKQIEIGRVGDTTAIGLDCKWYHKGVLIDSGAIITVNANAIKNAVDTYVVVQTICGLVKTDTVTVKTAGVGIVEYGFGTKFSVFPNPSNGTLVIARQASLATAGQAIHNKPNEFIHATIFDLLGRVVNQQNLSFTNKEATLKLNLPNATYILELKDEVGNVQRERIVIE